MKTTTEIIQKRKDEKIVRLKDALRGIEIKPISTGIDGLDELFEGGLVGGDLVVLSGRTGMGKTTVGLNFMKNYIQLNPVLFSYEVIVDRIYKRTTKMGFGSDPNIFTPKKNVSGDIEWIKDRVLEAIEIYDSKMVVIDHLDFLTSDHTSDDGRRNEIHSIITRLKSVAIEKELIIILQAHVTKGKDITAPLGNNDLADSRSITQLADFVIFVNRELDREGLAVGNVGHLVVTKVREGGKHGKVVFELTAGDLIKEIK